jgi:saccharopine dehydrogenase-like NADP-dependent oxidoreductase
MRERLGGDYEDAVLLRVLVRGERDGRPATIVYEMVERYDAATQQTATMRCTAVPTVVTALLLAHEESVSGGGADVPENVLPRNLFLDEVADRGIDIRSEWHDDFRDVTTKQPLEGEHV